MLSQKPGLKKRLHLIMTFLIMLAIGISGTLYLFFDVAQLQFKMEAHEEIAASARLETIKVPLTEFNNRKEQHEVWEKGKLYDVSSYVIINDTAYVSVLHDENEEGLVKNIVDSFEPNDKYSSDNIVHVCKHKIHVPGDGKVLVEKYAIGVVATSFVGFPLSYIEEYAFPVYTAVIKPPPQSVRA